MSEIHGNTHCRTSPSILYFGTPVVLVSTINADGSVNLAPISSAFWLGWRAVLGVAGSSQTAQNLQRTRQCTLNLPSSDLAAAVDRLALTTGKDPVPDYKRHRGYRHVRDKFAHAGLTRVPSRTVTAPRVAECPVAMEAVVDDVASLAATHPQQRGQTLVIESRVTAVYAHPDILVDGSPDHIDPDAWRPLIMSFQKFYGLGEQVQPSRLSTIPEHLYRSADFVGVPERATA